MFHEIDRLKQAIHDSFDEDELNMFLSRVFDKNLDDYAANGTYPVRIDALVKNLRRTHLLDYFLGAVLAGEESNTLLHRYAQQHKGAADPALEYQNADVAPSVQSLTADPRTWQWRAYWWPMLPLALIILLLGGFLGAVGRSLVLPPPSTQAAHPTATPIHTPAAAAVGEVQVAIYDSFKQPFQPDAPTYHFVAGATYEVLAQLDGSAEFDLQCNKGGEGYSGVECPTLSETEHAAKSHWASIFIPVTPGASGVLSFCKRDDAGQHWVPPCPTFNFRIVAGDEDQ